MSGLSNWFSADLCTNNTHDRDVFLSFRGPDSRDFATRLHSALDEVGILTFLDSKSLEKGDYISASLVQGIQSSRICIPIFSKDFAVSKWCLREVWFMEKCRKRIIPLFNGVSPSQVSNPDGAMYTKDFENHERRKTFTPEDISELKGTLERVGELPGWSYKESSGEEIVTKEVIKEVVSILLSEKVCLDIPKCFGLDWRAEDILRSVKAADHQKKIVKVGIHGMDGIGKTTLAKVVYKQLLYSRFELHCCLLGVGEIGDGENGLVNLQTQMLRDVSSIRGEVGSVDRGKALLQHSLNGKKILLLLDDIQSLEQLEALGGNCTDLGEGSCLLITSQNQHILKLANVDEMHEALCNALYQSSKAIISVSLLDDIQSLEQLEALGGNCTDLGEGSCLLITSQNQHILKLANVDEMHEVRGLPHEYAMKLFRFHAFPSSSCPDPELQTLSSDIVSACEGLPFALQLVGKTLASAGDINVWRGMTDKLKFEPSLQKILRVSYDALDPFEKEMFLDIACFLTGRDKGIAMIFWAALKETSCHASLRNLLQKSLVNLGPREEFMIHGCLKDLGRNLEMSPKLHKRTRLFDEDAVHSVMNLSLGKSMRARYLRYEPEERKTLKADTFMSFNNLRLLWLADVVIDGHFSEPCCFDDLKWLRWRRCSSKRLPTGMNLNKLIILEVTDSQITHLWDKETDEDSIICPQTLKVVILRGCASLEKLPAKIIYTQLQILDLHNCHSLRSLPDTVGNFGSLVTLNMEGCGVSSLPGDFGKLSSLKQLNLSWCKNLRNLPASFGNLTSLVRLDIHHNSELRQLPDTIGGLKALCYLDAGYCQLCDGGLPEGTFELSSLKVMHLEHNRFRTLPGGLEKLSALWEIHLDGCSELSQLPSVPPSLEMLFVRDCGSLDKLPCLSGLRNLFRIDVSGSRHLTEVSGLDSLHGLTTLKLMECQKISTDQVGRCLQGLKSLESLFIGGPSVSRVQLQSLYDSIQVNSFRNECLMSSPVSTSSWLCSEANGQKKKQDNCVELSAVHKYCAGYIVCCVSLGQGVDCQGTNRLCYEIERKQNSGPRKVIHPEVGFGRGNVLEIRVVRVESRNSNFTWLRTGDKMSVNAYSDHQQWKACFKFLMYEDDATHPPAEENSFTTVTFGV